MDRDPPAQKLPGQRHPGQRPPGQRPPRQRPPGQRPPWTETPWIGNVRAVRILLECILDIHIFIDYTK